MLRRLFELLFRCQHERRAFPITLKKRTYVVCLDCGRELPYDWSLMRYTKAESPPAPGGRVSQVN